MQFGDITEPIFLDKFIRDLKPKIKMEVELHDPQTLAEAVHLVDRYDTIVYRRPHLVPRSQQSNPEEDTHYKPMQSSFVPLQSSYPNTHDQSMQPSFVPQSQQSFQEDIRGESMRLDILRMTRDDISTLVQIGAFRIKAQSLKKLIGEERAHLRSINDCFKCRKQGHQAQDCPIKTSHPNSKKPGSPLDVDIPAGRRPLEIALMTIASPLDAPTIPIKTPIVTTTSETNERVDEPDNLYDDPMDEPDNFVDKPVNPEESDILSKEEPSISNERTSVKLRTSIKPREPINLVEEPITTPIMTSISEYIIPVDNLDDNLVYLDTLIQESSLDTPKSTIHLKTLNPRWFMERLMDVLRRSCWTVIIVLIYSPSTLQMLAIFHVFHVNPFLSNWSYGMRINSSSVSRSRNYRWKLIILSSPRHYMCCLYPIAMRFSERHSSMIEN